MKLLIPILLLLKKTKTIDGLEISNIRLVENNNVSQVVADVTNPTNGTLGDFPVEIIIKDKTNNEYITLEKIKRQ